MTTVARLKQGNLLLQGEVNERLPVVISGLISHYPFDNTYNKYIPGTIRYIRDWLGGNTANTGEYWVEIQALDCSGNNIALKKTVTASGTPAEGSLPLLTDGNTSTNPYVAVHGDPVSWMCVDLDGLYSINLIKVWHYYGDGRTFHNNKTEVSDDGIHWYTVFDSSIEGEYKETSEGHTIDLLNLGTTCAPTVSNCYLDTKGISVEESTTNLWNGLSNVSSSNGGWSVIDNPFLNCPFNIESKVVKCTPRSYMNYYTIKSEDQVTYPIGTTFTFQAWCYAEKNCNCTGPIHIVGEQCTSGNSQYDKTKLGTWQHLQFTVTSVKSTSFPTWAYYFLLYPNTGTGSNTWTTGNVYFANIQVEAKSYGTEYTPNKRDNSTLQIPLNVNSSDFTIFYKFKVDACWNDVLAEVYNKYMWYLYDKNTGKKIWQAEYRGTTSGTTSYPWIGFDEFIDSTKEYHHWHSITCRFTPGKDYWFALTKSGATWTKYGVSDQGYFKHSATLGDAVINAFVPSRIDFLPQYNFNELHDLSVYNRALSESEVLKISKNTFSVTKNGDVNSNILVERPAIPKGSLYFPLYTNSIDGNNEITPEVENNTAYENDSLWIGNTTNNLLPIEDNKWFMNKRNYQGTLTVTSKSTGFATSARFNFLPKADTSTDGWQVAQYEGFPTTYDTSLKYTLSFYVRVNTIQYSLVISLRNGNGLEIVMNTRRYTAVNSEWTRVQYTFTPLLATTNSTSLYIFTDPNAVFDIANPQLEVKPFASPFVVGTRNGGHLAYPSSLLNINSGAISLWANFNEASRTWGGPNNNNEYKMLFAIYGSNESNKLNIRSHYKWMANSWSAHVSNSTVGDQLSFIIPDGWHMITLAWDKSNAKWKVYVDNKLISEKTQSNLPEMYSSSLLIGQWDPETGVWGAINMYMKNLVIMNHYPTDNEIYSMYSTGLRAHNGSLQVQGKVVENCNL